MSGWTSSGWRWAVVLTSAAAIVASLTQVAFVINISVVEGKVDPAGLPGYESLILGPAGILFGYNLLLWPSIVATGMLAAERWHQAAAVAGLASLGLISVSPDTAGYTAWLANPVIVVAWLLYLRNVRRAALLSAVMAFGLALTFLLVEHFPGGPKLEMVDVVSFGAGYWLWIAAVAITTAGASADTILFRDSRSE